MILLSKGLYHGCLASNRKLAGKDARGTGICVKPARPVHSIRLRLKVSTCPREPEEISGFLAKPIISKGATPTKDPENVWYFGKTHRAQT
jgi:hypothetical protein